MSSWIPRQILCVVSFIGLLASASALARLESHGASDTPSIPLTELNNQLRVGDVIFIHVTPLPFKKVSEATQSWANHVGVVVDNSGDEAIVAESTFPFSRTTPISKFVRRSEVGRLAVARLTMPLTESQIHAIPVASSARLGVLYDTGFNLHSQGQYCSRFVHEVLGEAAGVSVGEVESFRTLLTRNPSTSLGFWHVWFFGRIPWERQTVTPASLYRSERLHIEFDGRII
jgi:hypothetical protein